MVHFKLHIRFLEDYHGVFELLDCDISEDVGLENGWLKLALLLVKQLS